jgi:hypothetical protein
VGWATSLLGVLIGFSSLSDVRPCYQMLEGQITLALSIKHPCFQDGWAFWFNQKYVLYLYSLVRFAGTPCEPNNEFSN